MYYGQLNQRSQILNLFKVLEAQLSDVPELEPAFKLIDAQPEDAVDVYISYIRIVESMAQLDDQELTLIKRAHARLHASNGAGGSASSLSASDLILALGEDKDALKRIALQSSDTKTIYFEPAMTLLSTRLRNGHLLKLSGKTVSDHDAQSLQVIWGHTLINEPTSLLHFLICHYLEKYFAKALDDMKFDFARSKDFLINALTDVVIVKRHDNQISRGVFERWVMPKTDGGLGWITDDRLSSYGTNA